VDDSQDVAEKEQIYQQARSPGNAASRIDFNNSFNISSTTEDVPQKLL
jgi:hypothetical protein